MKAARIRATALAALLLIASLAAPGCSPKGATEMVIKSAETSYAPIKDKLEKVMPEDAKAIEDKIAAAKSNVEKGDYKAAVEGVKDVPAQIKDLSGKIDAKMAELTTSWDGMAAALPGAMTALSVQVEKLGAMKKLPKGVEAASLDQAKAALATAQQSWTDAQSAQSSGNIAEAVTKAGEAKQSLDMGMSALGMSAHEAGEAATAAEGKK